MNIKIEKGVTLIVLVITIIIMLILTTVTFSSATDLLKNSRRNKMKTMLYMVQARAEDLLEDFLFENDDKTTEEIAILNDVSSLGGTHITELSELSDIGFDTTKIGVIYCSWDEDVLKSQGIDTKNFDEDDSIIIEYNIENNSVEVASTKGFSEGETIIHKLSDF